MRLKEKTYIRGKVEKTLLGNHNKEVRSLQICLSRRSTSPNALFDLKIGERLLLVRLSTFQGGGCVYIHYFQIFQVVFHRGRLIHLPPSLEFGQGKNTTFYFTESFRCFQLNKTVLETTETKQADSQLHFAPKIIKIHLLVFENELFEDAMPVPKKIQN